MVTLDSKFFQNGYCRHPSENFITASLVTQQMVDSKRKEMQIVYHYQLLYITFIIFTPVKNCHQGIRSCVVVNVVHFTKLYIPNYYHGGISIKINSKIKSKTIKTEGPGKRKFAYMKHKKIRSCHMGVNNTPKNLIRQRQQCVHIHSRIMH